ncbi:VOC family protein [Candidatus Bipolaricaulota bacterium]|nr:VOC family protein [Candidatus Bipolaricaulota bacterium]
MTNSIEAARIEWIVIPAPDLQTAETFYREVFGFTITPYSETYLVFKAGNISGALDQELNPSVDGLSFSLTVSDIDGTLRLIREFGGDVVRERYELRPGAGFCAKFKDPNGNVLELYSNPE